MSLRIAVIGAGPKCLFALQDLHDAAPPGVVAAVDLFDPADPGCGAVWRADLPGALRMNSPAERVDARFSRFDETLAEWVARASPSRTGETYVPRRLAGAYLAEAYERLATSDRMSLRHVRQRIRGFGQGHGLLDAGAYDEVLLSTGHASVPRGLSDAGAVAPGTVVDVRGAALTGIDATLLLTEGRGGGWRAVAGDPLGRLAYIPSGAEPGLIRLVSRTGAVMTPKPEYSHPEVDRAVDRGRCVLDARLASARTRASGGAVPLDDLWRTLLETAADIAQSSGRETSRQRLWRTLLTGRPTADAAVWAGRDQARFLRERLEIDAGLRAPDESWILGRTWFGLFRSIVRGLDRAPRSGHDQALLRRIASQQERTAFGPPATSARKLLALSDAGLLEFRAGWLPAGSGLDAVTAGPGVLERADGGLFHDPLYADLHRRGAVSVRRGERGILTDADGTCIGADGAPVTGLAAIGRPTEDPVIGHDTLDRTLHEDGRRWAAAVIARAARRAGSRIEESVRA